MLKKVELEDDFLSLTTTGDIFAYDIQEENTKAYDIKNKLEARIFKQKFLSRPDIYIAAVDYEGFTLESREFLHYEEAYNFLVNTENQVIPIAIKIAERLYSIKKSVVEDYQGIIYYEDGEK